MSYETNPDAPILIAVPDEWRDELFDHLTQRGYKLLTASARDAALKIIQSEPISGLIVISDWAMTSEDGEIIGLIEYVKGKIPSISLIRGGEGYRWFDELFMYPFHEYCHLPVTLDEIIGRIQITNMISNQTDRG